MLFVEPDNPRFLAVIERLRRKQQKRERLTRLARQKLRAVVRKLRGS